MTFNGQKSIARSTRAVENDRTIEEITEEYLRDYPREIDDHIFLIFEEYAQDGDMAALLSGLRIVCRIKGVDFIPLSEENNPKFESINAVMHALGYQLAPQKLQVS
jgi:DNA-binding phage protein